MTECERIIKEGLLPKSFFEEEIRNDFLVTVERKKIWAVELDLLSAFDRICKKYGLRYFLFWGSLLGAVRHNGFVPWDDDTDVVMPRKDYEELLKHGDEFQEPYFFQTPYTDKGFFYAHAKLRNSNTTAWDRPFAYQGTNFGVFLDILPLDNVRIDGGRERFDRVNKLILDNSTAMKLSNPDPSEKDKIRIAQYDGRDPYERYEEIHQLARLFENEETGYVSTLACTTYGFDRDTFHASDFDRAEIVDFEGLKFPIPQGYKRVLEISYGDYMQMPPIEKRGGWHGNLLFDLDTPYKDFIRKCKGVFPSEFEKTI